jgi:hypothetical protein
LSDLRRQLRAKVPKTHDWASVVAYGAFPADLDAQLANVRLKQAHRGVNAAVDHAEQAIARLQSGLADDERAATRLDHALQKLERARHRLSGLGLETEPVGLLGSAYKREAQVLFQMSRVNRRSGADYRKRSMAALECARENYEKAVKLDVASHWVVVQYLSLEGVLGARDERARDLWISARLSAILDLDSQDREKVAWAHVSLAELYLLSALYSLRERPLDKAAPRREAVRHARALARLAPPPFLIEATQRQFARYPDWFAAIAPAPLRNTFKRTIVPIAEAVLAALPVRPAE